MELPAENKHYTFADCLSWPENTRCELINGAAVMLAMPPRVHQQSLWNSSGSLQTSWKGSVARSILHRLQ